MTSKISFTDRDRDLLEKNCDDLTKLCSKSLLKLKQFGEIIDFLAVFQQNFTE